MRKKYSEANVVQVNTRVERANWKSLKKNGGQATHCWGASADNQGDKQKNHSWNRNFHKELQDEENMWCKIKKQLSNNFVL